MTVGSRMMMPKEWAEKSSEYIQEARRLGVYITPPSIQKSQEDFFIDGDRIYFGLNGIRNISGNAIQEIITKRPYADIMDFLYKVNHQIVNMKVFEALIQAGVFTSFGYKRLELLERMEEIHSYWSLVVESETRAIENEKRQQTNEAKALLVIAFEERIKQAKQEQKRLQKLGLRNNDIDFWADAKAQLKLCREFLDAGQLLDSLQSELIELYGDLRKQTLLKEKEIPPKPIINRYKQIELSISDMIHQAEYIGCYTGKHPIRKIFPDAISLGNVDIGDHVLVGGHVIDITVRYTRKDRQEMCVFTFSDGVCQGEVVFFPRVWAEIKEMNVHVGDIICIDGKITDIDPIIKVIGYMLKKYEKEE